MKKILLVMSFSALVLLNIRCSKSDSATSATSTKADLLTKHDFWNLIMMQHRQVNGTTWTDDFTSIKACSKDDRITFKSNLTIEVNEGPTKCNAGDPQVQPGGFWNFAENETVIVIKDVSGVQKIYGFIQTLNESSLKYSVTQTDPSTNITYEFIYSFIH